MSDMSPHNRQGSAKALAWLRAGIERGRWPPGGRLPTLETLAEEAGVGRLTMWKAVGMLCREGLLSAKRGRGIFFGRPPGDDRAAWHDIARQVARLIEVGEFACGESLPPQSKLQLRFSANYRTIHKALSRLSRNRVIVRSGSRYLVPALPSSDARFEVVFLSETPAPGNERQEAFAQIGEPLAQKRGIRLVRHTVDLNNPIDPLELKRVVSGPLVTGFVVDHWGGGLPRRTRNFLDLLAILHGARKPIAILDEVGNLALPDPLRSSKQVLVLTMAARIAGEDVGRFLLHLGHRRIAYLTLRRNEPWSERRFNGLRHAFGLSGHDEDRVELWSTESLPDPPIIVCAAARLAPAELTMLFPELSAEELYLQSKMIADTLQRLKPGTAEKDVARGMIMPIISMYRIGIERRLVQPVRDQMFTLVGGHLQTPLLRSLFDNLTRSTKATAWVAATDGTAIFALNYLKSRPSRLPGSINLCGFDNSLRAAMEDVTSYDFDAAGCFNRALSVAMGQRTAATGTGRVIEWPGQLIARSTTFRVTIE